MLAVTGVHPPDFAVQTSMGHTASVIQRPLREALEGNQHTVPPPERHRRNGTSWVKNIV
jgi:hypothetical protein